MIAASNTVEQSRRLKQTKRLVFFSLEDWNEIWRRNQFVCARLHERHPTAEILWVSPPNDIVHNFLAGTTSPKISGPCVDKMFPRIYSFKPVKPLPNIVGQRLNNWTMRAQIQSVLNRLGWTEFDTWINDHKSRRYAPFAARGEKFYDITDDWTQSKQSEAIRKRTVEDDSWLLKSCEAVIVCSETLLQQKKNSAQRIFLVPNGVDFERYHPDTLSALKQTEDISSIPRPRVGYTGTLHSDRLDIKLIATVAQAMPTISFVFVGPNALSPAENAVLSPFRNVHILGGRSYDLLPSYVAAFDVCFNPHVVTPFTESLDPLKLYEYMSTGRPIVSTPCNGFRNHRDTIYVGDSTAAFVNAIKRALETDDREKAVKRLDWAARQSWDTRVKNLEDIIGWGS